MKLSVANGLELVIVRPTLVCGAGAGGNLARLVRLCRTGLPLPFASVDNRRCLINVEDLADLLIRAVEVEGAANRVLLAADPRPLSTAELIGRIRSAIGLPPRLLPCPPRLLTASAVALGAAGSMRQLTDSLEVDVSATVDRLGWKPVAGLERALDSLGRGALVTAVGSADNRP
jgi:nucleoside-diphosphate-sugar epimerase